MLEIKEAKKSVDIRVVLDASRSQWCSNSRFGNSFLNSQLGETEINN